MWIRSYEVVLSDVADTAQPVLHPSLEPGVCSNNKREVFHYISDTTNISSTLAHLSSPTFLTQANCFFVLIVMVLLYLGYLIAIRYVRAVLVVVQLFGLSGAFVRSRCLVIEVWQRIAKKLALTVHRLSPYPIH